jgi:hypothetical protein
MKKRTDAATTTKAVSVASGIAIVALAVQPAWVSKAAVMTEPNASVEPTERSMPPVRITIVIPTATRPVTETCRSTSDRFPDERKILCPFDVTGENATPAANRIASPQ